MTSTKTRTTALITPVPQEAQGAAKALAAQGRTAQAIRRLRKESGLGIHVAPVALDLLTQGHALPTDYRQAVDALRRCDAGLVSEMTNLLHDGDQDSAIKLLREQTDIDLAGGYHLVMALRARPDGR
ncbi:hypothetical protein [Streptomyces orinoci]|uniref:Uncharacterized protein n=1 Tax=Streptomyces orinoci TaxID=67339 RepID=A0ABV3K7H3_STRON|nr:hypothetical protein [Streptomyces orinoci]